MTVFLYPYKAGSESAKALSQALGIKRIKLEGSNFKGSENKTVINWGSSNMTNETEKCTILNHPLAVSIASNKLKFFNKVKDDVNIPDFTTDIEVAKSWQDEGKVVVGRTVLSGHSGEGIYIFEGTKISESTTNFLNEFKVFTKYVPKKDEFRVHVVNGEVIDIRRKSLKKGFPSEAANWKIRSYDNGFIFAKEGFETPDQVKEQAIAAVKACHLDFGAVDVIWNNYYEKAYVLEVNTAPGLEGSTVDSYKEAFEKMFYTEEDFFVKLRKERQDKLLGKKWFDTDLAQVEQSIQNVQEQVYQAAPSFSWE